ncbi:hypothetical protein SLEP1_g35467 [Rubroshorea leprosula]|uniref:Uncharacterized protein n=1 Tax=Rubroshorea leprosula TaxID=152421 RepID=A0AAV5KNJ3_9ROSI|nr:hypothetical protein SLEP1_g35467 [Rubroshorea leprosula]
MLRLMVGWQCLFSGFGSCYDDMIALHENAQFVGSLLVIGAQMIYLVKNDPCLFMFLAHLLIEQKRRIRLHWSCG